MRVIINNYGFSEQNFSAWGLGRPHSTPSQAALEGIWLPRPMGSDVGACLFCFLAALPTYGFRLVLSHGRRRFWLVAWSPIPASTIRAGVIGTIQSAMTDRNEVQRGSARHNASERAPTKTRLPAQVASKLNQLRDTNFSPRKR
jgi:hypothetical protein